MCVFWPAPPVVSPLSQARHFICNLCCLLLWYWASCQQQNFHSGGQPAHMQAGNHDRAAALFCSWASPTAKCGALICCTALPGWHTAVLRLELWCRTDCLLAHATASLATSVCANIHAARRLAQLVCGPVVVTHCAWIPFGATCVSGATAILNLMMLDQSVQHCADDIWSTHAQPSNLAPARVAAALAAPATRARTHPHVVRTPCPAALPPAVILRSFPLSGSFTPSLRAMEK